jgi:Rhodopirellula transposase DDE domain
LVSHEVIVNLISATTTQTGLKVRAKLDTNSYPPGAKVSKSRSQRSIFIPTRSTENGTIQYVPISETFDTLIS